MKKKLSFCLVVLVLLAVGVLHYWAAPTFDHAFQCNGIGPPAKPGGSFKVLREGTYPGLSDAPVTFDEGRTYRELLAALRGQRYLPSPPCWGPPTAGPPSIPHPAVPPSAWPTGTAPFSGWPRTPLIGAAFSPFPPAAWGRSWSSFLWTSRRKTFTTLPLRRRSFDPPCR